MGPIDVNTVTPSAYVPDLGGLPATQGELNESRSPGFMITKGAAPLASDGIREVSDDALRRDDPVGLLMAEGLDLKEPEQPEFT